MRWLWVVFLYLDPWDGKTQEILLLLCLCVFLPYNCGIYALREQSWCTLAMMMVVGACGVRGCGHSGLGLCLWDGDLGVHVKEHVDPEVEGFYFILRASSEENTSRALLFFCYIAFSFVSTPFMGFYHVIVMHLMFP